MYATMFRGHLSAISPSCERIVSGRALAHELSSVDGFVAFIALETRDDEIFGLCICEDPESLEEAHSIATEWHHAHSSWAEAEIQTLSKGRVIVQFGL